MQLRDEDSLTEQLAAFLKTSTECLQVFLSIISSSKKLSLSWSNHANIQTWYRTDVGEIDLLITKGDEALIFECKVDDCQKVYQVRKYREWWIHKHQTQPKVYWLVRRKAKMVGAENVVDGCFLWDDIHSRLLQHLDSLTLLRDRNALNRFLLYMQNNDILLKEGERRFRVRKSKGFDRERSVEILDRICNAIPQLEFNEPEEMNELPTRICFGRDVWRQQFGDAWSKRVIIYYWADKGGTVPPYFLPQVVFYHKHESFRAPDYALSNYPQWAEVCAKDRMEFQRNLPGKWSGRYNVKLEFPFVIKEPVWFFFAQCPEHIAKLKWTIPEDTELAIELGIQCAEHHLVIVDRFKK